MKGRMHFPSLYEILADWILSSQLGLISASLILATILIANYFIGQHLMRKIFIGDAPYDRIANVEDDADFIQPEVLSAFYSKLNQNVRSPINIDVERVIMKDIKERLQWTGYRATPKTMLLKNTGVRVVLQAEFERNGPYLSGANLRTHYDFIELTFKWGYQDTDGSEHMLNYNKFPFELQAVHKSGPIMKDGDITFDIITVAYFCELSMTDSKHLKPICDSLKYIEQPKTQVIVKAFPLESLMYPFYNAYYSYRGTLEDLPKTIFTNWFICTDLLKISTLQLSQFRLLKSDDGLPMMKTSRLLKPVGEREVLYNCYNPEEEDIL